MRSQHRQFVAREREGDDSERVEAEALCAFLPRCVVG